MLPFELTKDTPYLALSGELWSVFYEYFNRNWPCYKGFLLYNVSMDTDDAGVVMTSWHANIFHITDILWGETTDHIWISNTFGQ